MRLACATANADKVREIAAVLGAAVELLPRPPDLDEVVEDTGSLVGNARKKARAVAAASRLPALADDTGLFVDACGGAPGVEAAYWGGPEASYERNRAHALAVLAGVPAERRTARFVTVAVVVWPDGREVVAEGVCEGRIAETERGERGWGYDPLFVPDDGDGRTFAEMTAAEKDAVSHRARALHALAEALGLGPLTSP